MTNAEGRRAMRRIVVIAVGLVLVLATGRPLATAHPRHVKKVLKFEVTGKLPPVNDLHLRVGNSVRVFDLEGDDTAYEVENNETEEPDITDMQENDGDVNDDPEALEVGDAVLVGLRVPRGTPLIEWYWTFDGERVEDTHPGCDAIHGCRRVR